MYNQQNLHNKRYVADIPGFPAEIGNYIDLPDIPELLLMPMYNNISADDFYKHGTEFQRYMLDQVPLRNRTKHVVLKWFIQFLYPEIGACDIKIDPKYENEWHIDADVSGGEYYWHIITSPCTSRTEFNINPFKLDVEQGQIRAYLNAAEKELGLVGRKIDSNKFCTFTNHVHRPAPPEKPEFRFFFRVQETNFLPPLPFERSKMFSVGDRFMGSTVHYKGKQMPNLDQNEKGITIYYPWGLK